MYAHYGNETLFKLHNTDMYAVLRFRLFIYVRFHIAIIGRIEVGWFAGMTHFSFLFCFFSGLRYFGDCCKVFSQYVNVTFYAVMLYSTYAALL